MKKVNLKKSVDFNKYVLNVFPQYKTNVVFKAAVPSGLIKVDAGSNGSIILRSNEDVIAMIDAACKEGRMSYFNNRSYVFHKCKFSIEEIGNGGMVMITISNEKYVGIGSHLWVDDDKDCPWWNGYYKKSVDGTRVHFADSDVDALQQLKEIMEGK